MPEIAFGEAERAGSDDVCVQDRAARVEEAGAALTSKARFLEATLSSIPDYVYAFDPQRRFAYANPAMFALFGLERDEVLGRTLAELDYSSDLAARLNEHIDRVFRDGVTVEDEVFYRSPTGYAAYFSYLWGPVWAANGSVELVVGVSRDTTERHRFEEELKKSEARLRSATELVGIGIYSWNPITGELNWDDRLRTMWGLSGETKVTEDTFESGIHPDDLAGVRDAINRCVDPAGDGRYNIEYRVIGAIDGVTRHIATSGRTTFSEGRAVGFIGAAVDVTAQRRNERAVRASEAQFRSFAEHSSNLIWISDVAANAIIYRSAAFERIWGVRCADAPSAIDEWMQTVHPDDRTRVENGYGAVKKGEVAQCEYRVVRPSDGTIRRVRDTSFPIPDENGAITRIGGITEDLTQQNLRSVYVVCSSQKECRRLSGIIRSLGYRTRSFESAHAFLDLAPVLAAGCVIIDLRSERKEGLTIARELRARSVPLPAIALDSKGADAASAVAAMKAGVLDYIPVDDEAAVRSHLTKAIAECHGAAEPTSPDEGAAAGVARLTPREREVLVGLVHGGTNKTIAQKLGISPRTVELHRAQVMSRLNARSLTDLLKIALRAGISSFEK